MRIALLAGFLVLLAVACTGAPAASPIIVYVTPPPATAPPETTSLPATRAPTSTPAPTAELHDLTVRVTVRGSAFGSSGVLLGLSDTTCATRGGYDDIGPGMQATIRDGGGDIVGLATFSAVGQSTATEDGPAGPVPVECTFETVAREVPDLPIYAVDLGRRGSVNFTRADLAGNDWTGGALDRRLKTSDSGPGGRVVRMGSATLFP